jgi:hypothetical protein
VPKRAAILLTVVVSALLPSAVRASPYSQVLQTYQATGTVPPCRFTSAELGAALRGIDTYGQQYFADFSNAVQSALTQRAAGACTRGLHLAASAAGPQAPLPASATSPTDGSVPLPLLLLAGLALLVALVGGAVGLARTQGWEPPWAAAWRHAWAEAGYRMAGGLGDAADRWRRR